MAFECLTVPSFRRVQTEQEDPGQSYEEDRKGAEESLELGEEAYEGDPETGESRTARKSIYKTHSDYTGCSKDTVEGHSSYTKLGHLELRNVLTAEKHEYADGYDEFLSGDRQIYEGLNSSHEDAERKHGGSSDPRCHEGVQ